MRVVVTGDRLWTDLDAVIYVFRDMRITEVTEGECRGLDLVAKKACEILKIPVNPFPADWDQLGHQAGPIRNSKMLDTNPDMVLAFHDSILESKGTKNCILQALSRKIKVLLTYHNEAESDNELGIVTREVTYWEITRTPRSKNA